MDILALDLGTKTGWATASGSTNNIVQAGTWELAIAKDLKYAKKLRMDRRLDIRASRLAHHLQTFHANNRLDWIFFEDVRFAHSQAQAHLWASFRGVVWAFAHQHSIEIDCLDTGKLKKFATGNGGAQKPDMAVALVRTYPGSYRAENGLVRDLKTGTLLDDNAVDALHLLDWALTLLT
jgi:Holliday junction resolvasome RuvABC endonuclease subunit